MVSSNHTRGGTAAATTATASSSYSNIAVSPPSTATTNHNNHTTSTIPTTAAAASLRHRRSNPTTLLQSVQSFCSTGSQCICIYPGYPPASTEYLEYHYPTSYHHNNSSSNSNNNSSSSSHPLPTTMSQSYQQHVTTQPLPRIRERGEFYMDSYNDQPTSWSFGTNENVRCDSYIYIYIYIA
jgi:hypothetical protein